ncbi:hypothetical protein K505DRAFT_367268 [Melanomma pulvis-pyrius CBS 109.77]|uniref:Uncharacterized protein n=1 Tax=Melanomma pulvis-pyrius CBS 109.77 TaxID=1314802 RepID=A0A6A6WUY5_9PLEO|nr:hypothetical protein K505DRAFT_367268 [Melanomma pulvis-pyrius CBS 109.77]
MSPGSTNDRIWTALEQALLPLHENNPTCDDNTLHQIVDSRSERPLKKSLAVKNDGFNTVDPVQEKSTASLNKTKSSASPQEGMHPTGQTSTEKGEPSPKHADTLTTPREQSYRKRATPEHDPTTSQSENYSPNINLRVFKGSMEYTVEAICRYDAGASTVVKHLGEMFPKKEGINIQVLNPDGGRRIQGVYTPPDTSFIDLIQVEHEADDDDEEYSNVTKRQCLGQGVQD